MKAKPEVKSLNCAYCEGSFKPSRQWSKYCSTACGGKARNEARGQLLADKLKKLAELEAKEKA